MTRDVKFDPGASTDERQDLLEHLLVEEGLEPSRDGSISRRKDPRSTAPLSFAQERLWFLEQLNPGGSVYHISLAVRVHGDLDAALLSRVLGEIESRHEVLRTTFRLVDGDPVQVIHPPRSRGIRVVDLRGLEGSRGNREARKWLSRDFERPFDLERGPLLRPIVARLGAQESVVSLTLHHLISDRWSREVLLRELSVLSAAFADGRPSPLPELPIQYADYAVWQRDWLTGSVLEEQLSYWSDRLRDVPRLDLPTDRPRPAVQSFAGRRRIFRLGPRLSAGLRRLSESQGATLFTTLLTALQVLLSRYANQDDVAVGTPIANRNRSEIEDLIGFFVNTLVLRSDLSGDPRFVDALRRVKDVAFDAYVHQDLPFEKLVQELEVDRDLSRTPLFQVWLVLQNVPRRDRDFGGVDLAAFGIPDRNAKFDLALSIEDDGEALEATLEYAADLFDRSTILRLVGHLQAVLEAAVERPEARLSEVDLLSQPERQHLLREWNARVDRPPAAATIPEGVRRWAERTPDAVAVSASGAVLTYGELASQAGRLARRLRDLGVGVGSRVGLFLERSPEAVVGILGILEAGAAYIPLDPMYPEDRLRFLMEDTRAPVLVTGRSLVDRLPDLAARLALLPSSETPAGAPWDGSERPLPSSLAYVMYTSGSTGRPKGVMVTHENLLRLFSATDARFGFGPLDTWTLFHSCAFDLSAWEICGALLHGGRVTIVPYLTSRSPDALLDLLERERVTVLTHTPSAFRQLVHADGSKERPVSLALRWVVFGGEALDPLSLAPWFERRGDRVPRLVNMYGITETTVHVTYREVGEADLRAPVRSMVGRPMPDLETIVVDPFLRPAPAGVPGEICVGGPGLARGYFGRSSLTASRFLPHPFSPEPGSRLYRSGDLARWSPSGDLEYIGRIDKQVKVRGFRVELGEIESALIAHPRVREAVVALRRSPAGDDSLVAWVTPAAGAPEPAALRSYLQRRLPEYMAPGAFVPLDEVPLTAHGKIDHSRLPEPSADRRDLTQAYVAPRTPLEETLAAIWGKALDLDRIGVHDNFFEIGGDSIRAVRVLADAKELGIELSLQRLFQAQTIAELAAGGPAGEAGGPLDTPEIPELSPFELVAPADREALPPELEDAYPLTSLQTGMLYHMQLEPERPVYHNVNTFHLRLAFDDRALREAVAAVVARHPVLRTSFDLTRFSEPLQLVHRSAEIEIGVEDLRHLDRQTQEAELARFVRREAERRFDVSRPPLLRFHVHRRSDESFQFTLTEFHPILDGWSLQTALAEVFDHYLSAGQGDPVVELPPLTSSFRDFVFLEREVAASPASQEFWSRWLEGAPFTELPPRAGWADGVEGFRVTRSPTPVSQSLSDRLRALARTAGVPVKTVLLAAHLKVLSVVSGLSDVVGGLASHGRPEVEDGDQVLGLFLNTLPFRLRLEPGSWRDLVDEVFGLELGLLPHRRFPLVSMHSNTGGQPLFDTQFNYVHFHVLRDVFESRDVGVGEMTDLNVEETHFALVAAFGSDILSGQVYLHLYCDRTRFSDEQIEALGRWYLAVLGEMAARPENRHEEFSPLAEDEASRVRIEPVPPPEEETASGDVPARVASWARTRPDAEAVVWRTGRLSFRALDSLSAEISERPDPPPLVAKEGANLDGEALLALVGGLRRGDVARTVGPGADASKSKLDGAFDALQRLRPLGPSERVRVVGPAEAWTAVWPALLWPLTVGATLVLAGAPQAEPPGDSAPAPATVLCPAGQAGALVRELEAAAAEGRGLPEAVVFLGREAVPVARDERLRNGLGVEPLSVVHLPGPSWTLWVAERGAPGAVLRRLPSSRPSEVAILDPFDQPVPVGVAGELVVDGERSGALARLLGGDRLALLGPLDGQARIRGRRVDLERIARELTALPAVDDAAVATTRSEGSTVRLGAYVVPAPGAEVEPRALLAQARARLEEPFVPAGVESLETIPRRHDGTVDPTRLPECSLPALQTAGGLAPRNELERTIVGVWREVLGVETVGVRDNFFDLGGHSLQMLQAHQKLQGALSREIPLMSHFRFPTVEALAEHLSGETVAPDFEEREARARDRAAAMKRQRSRRRRRQRRLSESWEESDNLTTEYGDAEKT